MKINDLPQVTRDYLSHATPEGERNRSLFDAACQFRDAGQTRADAESQLVPCALRDGLQETEARRAIASAYQLPAREPARGIHTRQQRREVCAYDYSNEAGALLFQVIRYEEPKDFRQRRPDGSGGYLWNMAGVRRVLYRLPQIKDAPEVWIVEGEKDADNLAALGFCATCNSGGGGQWRAEYSETLRGKSVLIVPDNDRPGREHAEQVARSLHGTAAGVRIVTLPETLDGAKIKDASDYIAAFADKAEAAEGLSLLAEGAAEYLPPTQAEPPQIATTTSALLKHDARSLADFAEMTVDEGQTLLGRRYLCRRGAQLFVGPSGIGKSSAAAQQDVSWSCGRAAFGISPTGELRILSVQAENDDGDMIEMAKGIFGGLQLSLEEIELVRRNTRYARVIATGEAFMGELRAMCEEFRPDLVRLDPLNAFLGDDAKDTRAVSSFCRVGLERIAADFNCGLIVNHHTPKTNHRDTSEWQAHDWMYAGAGAADLTNWARAVLVIEPIDATAGVFKFIAAKRGRRIGWRKIGDVCGEPETERLFCHSRQPGQILWREADEAEIEAAKASIRTMKTAADLLALVPELERIEKSTLINLAQQHGIGANKARNFINELLANGSLQEHRKARPGTNQLKFLARSPQPSEPKP
ncbi:MAG: AAA family ATPase [Verrucomicrobia bacterium]|nr:AAA family ATPase [Verrucomicrobiota bacterium]